MPYKAKGKCVYNTDTGEKVGCTKGSVKKYLAALYANVPDAKNESKIKELKKPMKNIKLSEIAIKIINENKSAPLMLNGKEVDVSSIELDGVDTKDYPDFSNAYILAAYYVGGAKLTDKEISQLRSENPNLVNDLAHDNLHEERDWLNNPAIERDFEKSDVSPEEYERERLGRYGRGGGYSGGYSSAPNMVGITFFDVPSGKEEEARKVGLTQLKSGKWGFKHRFDPQVISVASDREKSTVSAAEAIFGKGRYWEPKK